MFATVIIVLIIGTKLQISTQNKGEVTLKVAKTERFVGNERKTDFSFALLSFFRNFATAWRTYSALGKAQINLAFLSFFRNFAG